MTKLRYCEQHPEIWGKTREAAVELMALQAYISKSTNVVTEQHIEALVDATIAHLLQIKTIIDKELLEKQNVKILPARKQNNQPRIGSPTRPRSTQRIGTGK